MAIDNGKGAGPLGQPAAATGEDDAAARNERYQVRLAVRYLSAEDYVLDYAENLSHGGLFVVGAQDLDPLEEVAIRIDLPGFGAYDVQCRVAHVLSEERAERMGRSAGAGFAIMSAPEGFDQALSQYLLVLGRRRDVVVMVRPGTVEDLLGAAGYRVLEAPGPEEIVLALAGDSRVTAVVLPPEEADLYRQRLAAEGVGEEVLLEADPRNPPDDLLNTLDRRLRSVAS